MAAAPPLPDAREVTRTLLLVLAVSAAGAYTTMASDRAQAPSGDDRYWAFADGVAGRFDGLWDEQRGRYDAGPGGVEVMLNADLLLVHAVAAQQGHDGPARNDARGRTLVRSLVASPPYVDRSGPRAPGAHPHAPGWVSAMDSTRSNQHLVIDAQVVDALAHAWRARQALGLPQELARRAAQAIRRTARGRYWRWPAMRLNQINWYALVHSAAAIVGGDPRRARRELRRRLAWFTRGVRPRARAAGNLGPGLRFHYLPHRPRSAPFNVDSAEYASIVASVARFQDRPAPPLLRRWMQRVVSGYWTHSGYLNWDTGLSFRRWHQAKKLGLAQQALLGLARSPGMQPRREYGAWAKWLFDRGLTFYERVARRSPGGVAPGVLFGLHVVPQGLGSAQLGASRLAANAARAIAAGLGGLPAAEPPPLYSFDPDIGRLAVTTPHYSTAVVAVSQGALPYGGIELARLLDGDGEVAGGIGGRPPAAFGLVVRDRGGRIVLATQRPRTRLDRRVTPLRLTHAPAGVGATAAAAVGPVYAGPFRDLRATGTVSSPALRARTSHRFLSRSIETTWRLRRRGGAPVSADVLLPSWGRSATVVAVMRDGSRQRISRPRRLAAIERLEVRSDRSGYTVVPQAAPGGATVRLVRPAPQASAPRPGPAVAVRIAAGRFSRTALTLRLVL